MPNCSYNSSFENFGVKLTHNLWFIISFPLITFLFVKDSFFFVQESLSLVTPWSEFVDSIKGELWEIRVRYIPWCAY